MKYPHAFPPVRCCLLSAVVAISLTVSPASSRAQSSEGTSQISAQDAADLLEQLTKVEETVKKARATNNVNSMAIIRDAASSDAKAVALWVDSVREVEFRDKDKKEAEFREWRDRQGQRLQAPGAAAAVRLHLQYLLLTLRATEIKSESERTELMSSVSAFLDELGKAAKETLAQGDYLYRSVLDTPIARRYNLNVTVAGRAKDGRGNTQSDQYQLESRGGDKWCPVPGYIGMIYDSTLLPYLREKKDLTRLQGAWNKRIQQEAAVVAAHSSPSMEKDYKEKTLPELQWSMAKDLFENGGSDSGSKMLQVIQQNPTHRGARGWISDLKRLLEEKASKDANRKTTETSDETSGTTPPEAP